MTISTWATVIPDSRTTDLTDLDADEGEDSIDVPADSNFNQNDKLSDPNDHFEVYEIVVPDEDSESDEYFELSRELMDKNIANGWGNAGPTWRDMPNLDDYDIIIPGRTTRTVATGKDKLLVIFVNFTDSDTDSNHDPVNRDTRYFNESILFNQTAGESSLHNYMMEISYGQYNVTGECAQNSTNTNGWYTVNNTEAYFGTYEMSASPPNGFGNAKELVVQAVALADPDISYGDFDVDKSSIVDHVMIVHAGLDDANDGDGTGPGSDPQIWSHKGSVFVATNDGPMVLGYTMLAEKSLMGVYAHEYLHDIGIADWYNTSKGPDEAKKWEIMAGGPRLMYGGKNKPSHISTWNKEKLGWHTPITINETNNNQGIKTVRATSEPTNENTSFKVNLPNSNQWFYVENRWKNLSSFDAGLPDSGIIIWHVDLSKPGNMVTPGKWAAENANPAIATFNDAAYSLEDNQILFNVTTTPNTNYNNGTNTSIHMDMINNSGPMQKIRILLTGDPFLPGDSIITSVVDVPNDNGHEVNITWSKSFDDGSGYDDVNSYNVYINDTGQGATGSKHLIGTVMADDLATYSFIASGLEDKVTYYFSVTADDGPNEGSFSNNVSGIAYDNIARPPTSLAAGDTKDDDGKQITLTWTPSIDDGLDIMGYNISINDTGQGSGGAKHWIATVGPGNVSYTVSNLVNGIDYFFKVSAFDEVYNIGISGEGVAQAVDDSVGFPTGLASNPATWTSTNSFTLTWSNPFDNAGISGVYYKFDTYPLNKTDGTFVAGADIVQLDNRQVVGSGIHAVYVWLVDGMGNINQTKWDRTYLYYDGNAPDRPKSVVVNPGAWTSVNSFDINWTNPVDLTFVSGVYYKMDIAPSANDDGIFVSQINVTNLTSLSVSGDADIHPIWLWLADGMSKANYTNSTMEYIYYDATPPVAPQNISATPVNWSNINNFNVTWENPDDLSGVVGAYYKLNDPPISASDGTFFAGEDISEINGISVVSEGMHTIYVWLIDNASNINHLNQAGTNVYYDISPPNPPTNVIASPPGWTQSNLFSFNWTNPVGDLSGVNGVYYKVGSIPSNDRDGIYIEGKDINNLTDIVINKEGSYIVYFWLNDTAGNVDNKYHNTTFIHRDITPPGKPGKFIVTPDSWTNQNNFSVRWVNPIDLSGIAGAYYKLDIPPTSNEDGIYVKGSKINQFTEITVDGDGAHTIYIWLTDNANNTDFNNFNTTVLKYDILSPGAPEGLSVTPTYWSSDNSFTVTWTNPSDASGIRGAYYKVGSKPIAADDGDYVDGQDLTELKGLRAITDGIYDIYVWLKDGADNFNHQANSTVKIFYDNEPPKIKHTKIEAATRYVSINIYSVIEDKNANMRAAYVFYKTDSDFDYFSIPMTHRGVNYEAQIPSHKTSGISISYFIMALDNSEPANKIYFGKYGETYTNITAATDIDIALTDDDLAPPIITHEAVISGTAGQSITLTALVSDDASGISEVVLHYKSTGDASYKTKTMVKSYSYFKVTIDGQAVTLDGLGYYIKAVDSSPSHNTGYFGTYGQSFIEPDSGSDIDITVTSTDTNPPKITYGPTILKLTENSANIFWVTDEPADSIVDFGFTSLYTNNENDPAMAVEHYINLTGLIADTLYHFRVSSTDKDGNGPTYSTDTTFKTPAVGVVDTDFDGIPDSEDDDDDNDGMKDTWEDEQGFDPKDFTDAEKDFDGDGFSNRAEYFSGSDPLDRTSTPVGMADTIPPTITHRPVGKAKKGDSIEISAQVFDDDSGVKEVALFYRTDTSLNYTRLGMGNKTPYSVNIPASVTESADMIEYYILAMDYGGNINYFAKGGTTRDIPGENTDIDVLIKEDIDEDKDDIWTTVGEPFGVTEMIPCLMLLIVLIVVIIAVAYGIHRASRKQEVKEREKESEERYARRQREIADAAGGAGGAPGGMYGRGGRFDERDRRPQDVRSMYREDYMRPPSTPPAAPAAPPHATAPAPAPVPSLVKPEEEDTDEESIELKLPDTYEGDELELEEGEAEPEPDDEQLPGPAEVDADADESDEEIFKLEDDDEQQLDTIEAEKRWATDEAAAADEPEITADSDADDITDSDKPDEQAEGTDEEKKIEWSDDDTDMDADIDDEDLDEDIDDLDDVDEVDDEDLNFDDEDLDEFDDDEE
jgi:M6 family metalloprotease-like protein